MMDTTVAVISLISVILSVVVTIANISVAVTNVKMGRGDFNRSSSPQNKIEEAPQYSAAADALVKLFNEVASNSKQATSEMKEIQRSFDQRLNEVESKLTRITETMQD